MNLIFLCSLLLLGVSAQQRKPNILLILADDQDQVLGGMDYLPQIRKHLAEGGMNFTNFFVNTPVCCTSRAELMAGRYGHNNLVDEVLDFHNCMHANIADASFVQNQIGVYMANLGYSNALIGKYMNWAQFPTTATGACACDASTGCAGGATPDYHWPPGWHRWYGLCDPQSAYYNNSWNDQGVGSGGPGHDQPADYMTALIGNATMAWLRNVTQGTQPFFGYIAPHAPHIADSVYPWITTPAPWYEGTMGNRTLLQTPNYNIPNPRAHPLIANQKVLDNFSMAWQNRLYRARHESMFSVDDLVSEIVEYLDTVGQLNNTYIFFTSDNGYVLGQHCRPDEKFNVYENDIRVPMLVRGPGISPGSRSGKVTGLVDLAATFVELGGGDPTTNENLDGRSLVPLLREQETQWRDMYLIEYWTLASLKHGAPWSPQCNPAAELDCIFPGCPCHYNYVDDYNNTFLAARLVNDTHDILLAQFYVDWVNGTHLPGQIPYEFEKYVPYFIEVYDHKIDPWQMNNLYPGIEKTQPGLLAEMRAFMYSMNKCKGSECRRSELPKY